MSAERNGYNMKLLCCVLCVTAMLCTAMPPARGAEGGAVFIDNTDAAFSRFGNWIETRWNDGYFGVNYCADPDPAANAESWARWDCAVTAGMYEVYLRWAEPYGNAPTDAPVTVRTQNGEEAATVNQTEGGGEWRPLGTYALDGGSYVKLSAASAGYTIADAVKLVPAEPPADAPIPAGMITQQSVNRAVGGNVRGFGMLARYDGGALRHVYFRRTSTAAANEPFTPIAHARVFDPDGTLVAYSEFTEQKTRTETRVLQIPNPRAGVYRVSFSGGRTGDLLEIGIPPTEIWGVRGEPMLGVTPNLPETLYLYAAETTRPRPGDEHGNTLPSGFIAVEAVGAAQAELFDPNGATLGSPSAPQGGGRKLLTVDAPVTDGIYKLNVGGAGFLTIDGVPGLLCPTEQAARALRGGTAARDGFVFAGALQARLYTAMRQLAAGDLAVNLTFPTVNDISWDTITDPRREALFYGRNGILSGLDAILSAQITDAEHPRFGQVVTAGGDRAVNALAAAVTQPGALNPAYGNAALARRAILNSMSELLWISGEDLPRTSDLRFTTYPVTGIIFSYHTLIAETYALLCQSSVLSAEQKEVWKQAVLAVGDKLADLKGYQSNQWSFMMLGHLRVYAATGEARFLGYFERQSRAYLTAPYTANSKYGQHPAGYFLEEAGPDGNYDSLNMYHTVAAYHIYKNLPAADDSLIAVLQAAIQKNFDFKKLFWIPQPDGTLFSPTAMNCRADAPLSSANYPGDTLARGEFPLAYRKFMFHSQAAHGNLNTAVINNDAWAADALKYFLPYKGAYDTSASQKGVWLNALLLAYDSDDGGVTAGELVTERAGGVWELPGVTAVKTSGGLYALVMYDVAGATAVPAGKFGGGATLFWSEGTGSVISSMKSKNAGDITHTCVTAVKADGGTYVSGGEHP
ncbi:MAG: hypothetical protein LBH54_03505, partial [Clostridiales bacterium]|nr:hypothetical protein [Clostridiales bacterium]